MNDSQSPCAGTVFVIFVSQGTQEARAGQSVAEEGARGWVQQEIPEQRVTPARAQGGRCPRVTSVSEPGLQPHNIT